MTPERFTPEGLRAALQGSIAALGGSAGLALKALLPRDPTGEMSALISQMAGGPLPNSSEGVWASGDGSLALLAALTAAPGADTDAQERALARLQAAFEAAAPPASGVRLLMTGAPVFSVDARRTIRSEVGRLSLAGTLTVFFMMLAFYRSLRNVLIGLLPVATGIAAAIAAVALGFETVHAITIGFAIEQWYIFRFGRGKRVMHSVVAVCLFVPFEQREIDNPQTRIFVLVSARPPCSLSLPPSE